MRSRLTFIFTIGLLVALLIWLYQNGKAERALEEQQESPIQVPSRLMIKDGSKMILLDGHIQESSDIQLIAPPIDRVPESSVIWLDGKSWIYMEDEPHSFRRHEVVLDAIPQAGTFHIKGHLPMKRMVIRGAQLLLSEEFRSQIRESGTY